MDRRIDDRVLTALRGGESDVDRATERVLHDLAGLAVGTARHLAKLPVEEDPVVELAAPAVEVGVTDQPGDLRERIAEGRTVDRDPAAPRAGTLDHLDPVVLGGRPVARREGGLERLDVHRVAGDGRGRDRRPRRARRRGPRLVAHPRRAVLPELLVRGDIGEPAEVVADARPGQIRRADRPEVDGRNEVERQARGPAGSQRCVAQRRLDVADRRSEPRRLGRRVAQGHVVADGDSGEQEPRHGGRDERDADPGQQASPPNGRPALQSAGDPEPAEEAGGEERDQPRVDGLERRQERPRPECEQLGHHAGDRWHEAQEGQDAEGHDRRERHGTPRDGRPDRTGQGDRDRGHGRQADDDVERPARPVRQQHEPRRHRPADDERDGDEAKFEGADPHVP